MKLEALQLIDKGAPFEMIAPQSTIFSEHPVVIVDRDTAARKARAGRGLRPLSVERSGTTRLGQVSFPLGDG